MEKEIKLKFVNALKGSKLNEKLVKDVMIRTFDKEFYDLMEQDGTLFEFNNIRRNIILYKEFNSDFDLKIKKYKIDELSMNIFMQGGFANYVILKRIAKLNKKILEKHYKKLEKEFLSDSTEDEKEKIYKLI